MLAHRSLVLLIGVTMLASCGDRALRPMPDEGAPEGARDGTGSGLAPGAADARDGFSTGGPVATDGTAFGPHPGGAPPSAGEVCAARVAACDVATGAGCAAGQKCLPDEPGTLCACAGPGRRGDRCATTDEGDTCAARHACSTEGICLRICGGGLECPSGERCADGTCVPRSDGPCAPASGEGCGPGAGCYVTGASEGAQSCLPAGSLREREPCRFVNDCAPGLLCTGEPARCLRLCDWDGTPCPLGQLCFPIEERPTLGLCG